eukprot:m.120851 g.120851  ORF g.120851 m.120851 type:complete len:763 (+) comp13691_c0_seq28:26-2314(+)
MSDEVSVAVHIAVDKLRLACEQWQSSATAIVTALATLTMPHFQLVAGTKTPQVISGGEQALPSTVHTAFQQLMTIGLQDQGPTKEHVLLLTHAIQQHHDLFPVWYCVYQACVHCILQLASSTSPKFFGGAVQDCVTSALNALDQTHFQSDTLSETDVLQVTSLMWSHIAMLGECAVEVHGQALAKEWTTTTAAPLALLFLRHLALTNMYLSKTAAVTATATIAATKEPSKTTLTQTSSAKTPSVCHSHSRTCTHSHDTVSSTLEQEMAQASTLKIQELWHFMGALENFIVGELGYHWVIDLVLTIARQPNPASSQLDEAKRKLNAGVEVEWPEEYDYDLTPEDVEAICAIDDAFDELDMTPSSSSSPPLATLPSLLTSPVHRANFGLGAAMVFYSLVVYRQWKTFPTVYSSNFCLVVGHTASHLLLGSPFTQTQAKGIELLLQIIALQDPLSVSMSTYTALFAPDSQAPLAQALVQYLVNARESHLKQQATTLFQMYLTCLCPEARHDLLKLLAASCPLDTILLTVAIKNQIFEALQSDDGSEMRRFFTKGNLLILMQCIVESIEIQPGHIATQFNKVSSLVNLLRFLLIQSHQFGEFNSEVGLCTTYGLDYFQSTFLIPLDRAVKAETEQIAHEMADQVKAVTEKEATEGEPTTVAKVEVAEMSQETMQGRGSDVVAAQSGDIKVVEHQAQQRIQEHQAEDEEGEGRKVDQRVHRLTQPTPKQLLHGARNSSDAVKQLNLIQFLIQQTLTLVHSHPQTPDG